MPLEIHPITTEADLLEWCHIHYEAFKDTSVGCLWTSKPSAKSFQEMADFRTKLFSDPSAHIWKCVDTELDNKMIAVAYWGIEEKERTPEQVDAGLQLRPPFPEENREAKIAFMDGIFKSRREWGCKPQVMLESLVTHPDHHRRGAGSMLVKWGVEQADRLGLLGYLEASGDGAPLYRKFGFEQVNSIEYDTRPFGGDTVDIHEVCFIYFFLLKVFGRSILTSKYRS
jgi:GNAT superfamily N-acetyltransferase